MKFEGVCATANDYREEDLLGFARVLNGQLCQRGNVVANPAYVLTCLFRRLFHDEPNGGRARERMFPVLPDRIDVA